MFLTGFGKVDGVLEGYNATILAYGQVRSRDFALFDFNFWVLEFDELMTHFHHQICF